MLVMLILNHPKNIVLINITERDYDFFKNEVEDIMVLHIQNTEEKNRYARRYLLLMMYFLFLEKYWQVIKYLFVI